MTAKYGTPYFSNYINSDMKPSDVRSMCCRLRLDLRELRKQNGGNFGAGENTGSVGVVTINLPHLAYISQTESEFFMKLVETMDLAAESLDIKRKIVTGYLERPESAYPYTRAYLTAGLKNHFSTIGIIGMNEACLNAKWLQKDLTHPECIEWANKVLDYMREKLSDYQEKYGCLFNLEATPAESTCRTLARIDKKQFPDIITAAEGDGTPFYTNSTHLPVNKITDVFEALDMEDEMQTKYTSGTVFHAFLGERLPDWRAAMILVRKIAENYKLPYFTISPTYSVCPDHGYLNGEHFTCPNCGKSSEVYSRITGYYRPVQNWNAGKKQEYTQRREYTELSGNGMRNYNSKRNETTQNEMTVENPGQQKDNYICNEAGQACEGDALNHGVIFATPTCPNCKMICAYLDRVGFPYTKWMVDDHLEKVKEYNITQAPTLVIDDGKNEPVILAGAGAIKVYIDAVKK